MRRLLYILLSATVFLSSCEYKIDYSYMGSVDKRLTAKLQEYQDILVGAPYGWIMDVDTELGGTHKLWMGFDAQGNVEMYTDYAEYYRPLKTTSYTSTYALKALQVPSISFDTYSYLSVFADPNQQMNGAGRPGTGMIADFEYEFVSYKKGLMTLKGSTHGMNAVLVQATQQEYDQIKSGILMESVDKSPVYEPRFYVFSYQGVTYELVSNGRRVSLNSLEGRSPIMQIVNCQNDFDGNILLSKPLILNGNQIVRFNKFADYYTVAIGSEEIKIQKSTSTPLTLWGARKPALYTTFYMFNNTQTEWSQEYYRIHQQVMTNLWKATGPFQYYVQYIGIKMYINDVAQVEIGYNLVRNGSVDMNNIYAALYYYDLTTNADGTYTFGDWVYMEGDNVAKEVASYSTAILDGYFKNRTFMIKPWPKTYPAMGAEHPMLALMPIEGRERTGFMVGFAYDM